MKMDGYLNDQSYLNEFYDKMSCGLLQFIQ